MAKYKYVIHYPRGDFDSYEEQEDAYGGDGVFDSYEEAYSAALEDISCYRAGAETLNLSNPGDYDYNEDEDIDFDVFELDDED